MRVTVTEGLRRAAVLIPFHAGNVQGNGVYVCSPASEVPENLRDAARTRSDVYMRTGHRSSPGYAPRYVVTSYGTPIAWVTLDGRTHFATDGDVVDGMYAAKLRGERNDDRRYVTVLRHRDTIRASWPERFPAGE